MKKNEEREKEQPISFTGFMLRVIDELNAEERFSTAPVYFYALQAFKLFVGGGEIFFGAILRVVLVTTIVTLATDCVNDEMIEKLNLANGKKITINVGMPADDAQTRIAFDSATKKMDAMSFTIRMTDTFKTFNIPFSSSGTTPAHHTVIWGDGTATSCRRNTQ